MLLSEENSFGLCLSFLHRWQLPREGVETCGGVKKGSVKGLGEFMPLWRTCLLHETIQGNVVSSKPGTPLFVFLFYVFIFVFSFFLIYMPMDVVSPVCMFVYTAVYMLAADGAVFDTTPIEELMLVLM